MDTKKLRQKILDLAIHGKLVPQDPNDEPASVLLERIRKEKERLIKEGKIKAPKKSKSAGDTSHYPKEGPWELPEGWCWCKLEELCVFLSRGKSPVYSETSKEYPVFAQKCNLKEGGISLEKALFLNPSTLPKWPKEYRLKTGDVLVNSTGTGTVGRTRLFNEQVLGPYPFVVPDSHVSVIRTFNQISSEYVFILLSSEYGQNYFADNLAGSTNQKELYIASIAELQVPLPPIEEQRRIAEQVFTLGDIIKKLDEEKIQIQSFVNSTKAKILELAIHGKLVQQDSSEEPAIELLMRINPDFKPSDNLHY
ncbi:MAG: restriction endonuclease subunit S, partial [Bacteroidales bacterium]|nr:restriction endonuclease subunit S [Bacteroidales bacterium]